MNAGAFAPPRLFTVAEYYRRTEAGIFGEDDRVELIEGEVVAISPIGSRHAACVERLGALIRRALSAEPISVRFQNPVRLGEYSEPLPDVSVVRARDDFYATAHPTAPDVVLLIEVADASLMYDRHTKIPLYARSGIAELWLVDLVNQVVEVHSAPAPAGYGQVRCFEEETPVTSAVLPQIGIAASEILG